MINLDTKNNKLLKEVLARVNKNTEIKTMWEMTNTNAIKRMGYSDHGVVHFQIVAEYALQMTRILVSHGSKMGIVRDYALTKDHGEVVVVLASLFHDLGMTINRKGHEEYSLFLALKVMDQILDFMPIRESVIVRGEVLHAIINHRDDGFPTTLEAGIVRVADALDMSMGRSRIPFEKGEVNIHSLSAYAINSVTIAEGKNTPVEIKISMNNSSGLFQVDELLKEKLKHSGIEKLCGVTAFVEGDSEKKLISEFVVSA